MHREYRTAYRFSVLFLWFRRGGWATLFLVVAAFLIFLLDVLPGSLIHLAWITPLAMAAP
jgi:hypothetical protein